MSTMRIRDLGYSPGDLPTGPKNSILDVKGVRVGQVTLHEEGSDIHTGVTVILPRHPDDIQKPCYAGIHTLNGGGEVSGSYQIREWGVTNTPLALTNSVSLGKVWDAIFLWMMEQSAKAGQDELTLNRNYGAPVVGETHDGYLNDMSLSAIEKRHVYEALEAAMTQEDVQEGSFGGGTGMRCHQYKGGTGTASRVVSGDDGKQYTVGVLVQSNYGHLVDMSIGGVPIGRILAKEKEEKNKENAVAAASASTSTSASASAGRVDDGSIVIYIITDAPLLPHQLTRLAQRATVGLAQVGGRGIGRTFSGDIFVALSTHNIPREQLVGTTPSLRPPMQSFSVEAVRNECIDLLFSCVAEATEEAILNSLVGARDGFTGRLGRKIEGLPVARVAELLEKYLVKV